MIITFVNSSLNLKTFMKNSNVLTKGFLSENVEKTGISNKRMLVITNGKTHTV